MSGVKRGERAGHTHTHTHDDGIDLAGTDSPSSPNCGIGGGRNGFVQLLIVDALYSPALTRHVLPTHQHQVGGGGAAAWADVKATYKKYRYIQPEGTTEAGLHPGRREQAARLEVSANWRQATVSLVDTSSGR